MEPATSQSREPDTGITFGCWTQILDGISSFSVFLCAWANHSSGVLHVYPDEEMVHALAYFPLGHLDTSIILTENVITVQTSQDSCSFQCESKQQQADWLKVLRYPLLSPLPINNSKGWKWSDQNNLSQELGQGSYDTASSQKRSPFKGSSSGSDTKIKSFLEEQQERNRMKVKKRIDQENRLAKKKDFLKKTALKKYRERLMREGREDELNWTHGTKNLYKTLGVEAPTSLRSNPSLYSQQLNKELYAKGGRNRKDPSSKQKASPTRNAKTDIKICAHVENTNADNINTNLEFRRYSDSRDSLFEDDSINGHSLNDISQLSSQVRELLHATPITFKNALLHAKGSHIQSQACVRIQALWRGFSCRNIEHQLNKHYSAILLQKAWLLYKYRQVMKKNFQELLENKRKITIYHQQKKNSEMLEMKANKKKNHEKVKLLSCVIIQNATRAYLRRKRKNKSKSSGLLSNDAIDKHEVIRALTLCPGKNANNSSSSGDDSDTQYLSSCRSHQRKKKKKKKRKKMNLNHCDPLADSSSLYSSSECTEKKLDDIDRSNATHSSTSRRRRVKNSSDMTGLTFKNVKEDENAQMDISMDKEYDPSHKSIRQDYNNCDRADEDVDKMLTEKISSANKIFKDAVRKVITQQNVVLDIFGIDESQEDYTNEVPVFKRQPQPPPRSIRPSFAPKGLSFRRLLAEL